MGDVAEGRIPGVQGPPRERPEGGRKLAFQCEPEIVFTARSTHSTIVKLLHVTTKPHTRELALLFLVTARIPTGQTQSLTAARKACRCGATIRMRIRIAARSDAPNWGDCCLSYFAPALAKVSPNSWQPNARPVRRSQGARSAPRSGLGLDAEHGSGTPRATIGMRPFPAEEPGAKLVEAWQRPALLRECWFPLMRPCDLREFLRVPQGPKQQCVRLFASPCF